MIIGKQKLTVQYVTDALEQLTKQAKLVQSVNKFAHIDPVFHSCIKQLEGLLNAEQNYLNKLVRDSKV